MQLKKVFAACLVVVLAVSAMAFGASASDVAENLPLKVAVGVSSPTAFYNQPLTVAAGADIEVVVAVEENPGTYLVEVSLEYDATAFTLINAVDEDGNVTEYESDHVYGEGAMLRQNSLGKIKYVSPWSLGKPDTTETGRLFVLKFKVNADYDGSQVIKVIMTDKNVITNRKDVDVPVEITNGNAQVEIHDLLDSTNVVAPDCENQGYTGYACSKCDYVLKTEYVDALGHKVPEGAEANCTANVLCETCGEVVYEQLPHTEVIDPAVPPTVDAEGKTEGKHCSACGFVILAQESVAKLPAEETQTATETESSGGGCGSLVGLSMVTVAMTALAATIVLKKKED